MCSRILQHRHDAWDGIGCAVPQLPLACCAQTESTTKHMIGLVANRILELLHSEDLQSSVWSPSPDLQKTGAAPSMRQIQAA